MLIKLLDGVKCGHPICQHKLRLCGPKQLIKDK